MKGRKEYGVIYSHAQEGSLEKVGMADGDIGEGGSDIGFCNTCQVRPMMVLDLLRTSKYIILVKVCTCWAQN